MQKIRHFTEVKTSLPKNINHWSGKIFETSLPNAHIMHMRMHYTVVWSAIVQK